VRKDEDMKRLVTNLEINEEMIFLRTWKQDGD
jgi:hypothetical protein